MKLYLTNNLKSLLYNKKSTLSAVMIVALSVILPTFFISVVTSFAGNAFLELENISYVLHIYTTDTDNALYKLVTAVTIVSLFMGAVVMLWYLINSAIKFKPTVKQYLTMGASYNQITLILWVRNLLIFVAGFVVGVGLSLLLSLLVGAIASVNVIFSVNIMLVTLLIYFALVTIISVVVPVWTNTGKSL